MNIFRKYRTPKKSKTCAGNAELLEKNTKQGRMTTAAPAAKNTEQG